jgi:transcriptional regulator with XRE-family HTH domain
MNRSTGERIRDIRKRRGLSQKELAQLSGLSRSWVQQQEEGIAPPPPLETLRKVAGVLKVPTSALAAGIDPGEPHPQTAGEWTLVRDALYGRGQPPGSPATAEGVLEALKAVRPALAANRYAAVAAVLPDLIRDAGTLGWQDGGARSRVLNLAAWLLTQTRQWDAAEAAAHMAQDAARGDRLLEAAALNTLCWSLLRQGDLAGARDLAGREAARAEPRFSAATTRELSAWGRLLLCVTNAAARDNRPGEAADALSLASAAAERIGREVSADGSTTRTFGPATVRMIAAENAALGERPDEVLVISAAIGPAALYPLSASRCRHRLDVVNAWVMKRNYPEAISILQELRAAVPQWLVEQGYARKILQDMFDHRRTVTPEMRDLADAVRLPL